MQIFIRNTQGKTITLNVENYETICTVKAKSKEKEGIRSHLHVGFLYGGKLLEDRRTLAHYNISKESTLHILVGKGTELGTWIYVKIFSGRTISLWYEGLSTIDEVKAKIQEEEGIPRHEQSLFFMDKRLEDGSRTLKDYHILGNATLRLVRELQQVPRTIVTRERICQPSARSQGNHLPPARTSEQANLHKPSNCPVPRRNERARPETQTTPCPKITHQGLQPVPSQLTQSNVSSRVNPLPPARTSEQAPLRNPNTRPAPQVAPPHTKRARPAPQATSTNNRSIINTNDEEVCAEYIQGLATPADRQAMSYNNYDSKLKLFALHQAKATAALSDLMPDIRARPPSSVLTELEYLKREMASARNKEKKLEATISGLTQKDKLLSAENKRTKEELMVARSQEKILKDTISKLTRNSNVYSAQVVALEAEDKKTKEELMVTRSKVKELEASISRLTHKNKVFSVQCASYESKVDTLEAENKKTVQELSIARATGYAEGLKEGKAKRLKSVEYLHHLTDASMQYFEYGFGSCQKQVEQQGFVGQLNKFSALMEAPEIKGWESSDLPH